MSFDGLHAMVGLSCGSVVPRAVIDIIDDLPNACRNRDAAREDTTPRTENRQPEALTVRLLIFEIPHALSILQHYMTYSPCSLKGYYRGYSG